MTRSDKSVKESTPEFTTGYMAALNDQAWDQFLLEVPGGDHTQSSHWATLKSQSGWELERLVVMRGDQPVAGAQMLFRSLPFATAGKYGYVQNGPAFRFESLDLQRQILEAIASAAKRHRVRYLAVMPPLDGMHIEQDLTSFGYRISAMSISLKSTVLLDLSRDLDDIMAGMKSKTRYNLRLGLRQGITVREGNQSDIGLFHQLLRATSHRQHFHADDEAYLNDFWRILSPVGLCKLFVAEHEGDPLSAMLVVPFRNSVIYKRGAWGGKRVKLRPNEVMHWHAIQWAKAAGYDNYDFGGLDPVVARAIVEKREPPSQHVSSVARFKLGFGGVVTLLPDTYDYVFNPVLRPPYRVLMAGVRNWSFGRRLFDRVRNYRRHRADG